MISQLVFRKTYMKMIKNREKVLAYTSNLGTWETRLNDEARMLINSIQGSVNAEKFINKSGKINVSGFMNHVRQRYPKFYNSEMFRKYNKQVIHLQGKIRYEKQAINKHIRWFNEDVLRHPYLSRLWNFETLSYGVWNKGRDVDTVSGELNMLNKERFR